MAFDTHANLLKLPVTVAPAPATSGVTLSISNANATVLATAGMVAPFNLVVCPSTGVIDPTTSEIIRVTAIGAADSGGVGNTQLTITRQAETGGINRTIVVGDLGIYTITKKTLTDLEGLSSVSLTTGETPGGLVNGSNTIFTTAALLNPGSLRVFQNGIRLKGGGVDYTEGVQGFTMVTAPLTGDILTVDYNVSTNVFAVGANAFIYNDIPSGTINGTNAVFTTTFPYVGGTTQVYRDGQLMQGGGNDYAETTPGSGIITFTTAPVTGSTILVSYQKSISTAGNASTVNGISANQFPLAAQLIPYNGGWYAINATLTYSSTDGHTFVVTTSTDLTGLITSGMKIKVTNQAATQYFFVTAITTTTITLYGGTQYSLTNTTISTPYFSHEKSPFGFLTRGDYWTERYSDNLTHTASNPTLGTWYNPDAISLAVPIGAWRVSFQCLAQAFTNSAQTEVNCNVALSTANNSSNDAELFVQANWSGTSTTQNNYLPVSRAKTLVFATKTPLYLVIQEGNEAITNGGIRANYPIIEAISSYL